MPSVASDGWRAGAAQQPATATRRGDASKLGDEAKTG